MRTALALILALFLFGCAKPQQETIYVDKVVEVAVPVIKYPHIEEIQCPQLPIKKLTLKSTNQEVVEAYVQSVKIQNDCIELYKKTIRAVNKANSGGNGE